MIFLCLPSYLNCFSHELEVTGTTKMVTLIQTFGKGK